MNYRIFFVSIVLCACYLLTPENVFADTLENYLINNPPAGLWMSVGKLPKMDTPILTKADHWIDIIDAKLRQKYPTYFAKIPKPKAFVQDSSRVSSFLPNASVQGTPICLQLPLPLIAGKATENISEKKLGVLSIHGNLDVRYGLPNCNTKKVSLSELPEYIRLISQFYDCPAEIKNLAIQISNECPMSDMVKRAGGLFTHELVISVTPNIVFLSGSLDEALNGELGFVSVLAHELGHYYLAHNSRSKRNSGFYFFQDIDRKPFQPPIPLSKELEDELEVADLWRYSEHYKYKSDPKNAGKKYFRGEENHNIEKTKELLRRLVELRISKYTPEMIADEFSVLILKLIGVDPKIAVQQHIYWKTPIFKQINFETPLLGPNPQECELLYKAQWKSNEGADVFIPFGTFEDIHGSHCHRAFNLDRHLRSLAK